MHELIGNTAVSLYFTMSLSATTTITSISIAAITFTAIYNLHTIQISIYILLSPLLPLPSSTSLLSTTITSSTITTRLVHVSSHVESMLSLSPFTELLLEGSYRQAFSSGTSRQATLQSYKQLTRRCIAALPDNV